MQLLSTSATAAIICLLLQLLLLLHAMPLRQLRQTTAMNNLRGSAAQSVIMSKAAHKQCN